jgi:hypothetical protein
MVPGSPEIKTFLNNAPTANLARRTSSWSRSTFLAFHCMEARWSHLGLRALKHDQLPNYPNLVETQYYVDTLVIAPNFKVAALNATPLVEILDHIDLTFTQAKSSGHLDPAMAGIGLYPNLHVCAALFPRLPLAEPGRPAGALLLRGARERQGIGGNILRDDAARTDIGALPDLDRRHQRAV